MFTIAVQFRKGLSIGFRHCKKTTSSTTAIIERFTAIILFTALAVNTVAEASILVVAPHPDDDLITAAGVIHAANQRGEPVTVVFMTNGDALGRIGQPPGAALGLERQGEAVNGQKQLGTNENNLIFLGYPDGGLPETYSLVNETDEFLAAKSGLTATYGNRGFGGSDYHNYRFGSHASYNRFNMVADLKDIINTRRPTHIITVAEFDQHPDHATTYLATRDAVLAVTKDNPTYVPVFNKTLVWSTNSSVWPNPRDPQINYSEPSLAGTGVTWTARESLQGYPTMQSATLLANLKYLALSSHASQGGGDNFLGGWLHREEFFWPVNLNGSNQPPIVNAGLDQTVNQGRFVQIDGSASFDPEKRWLSYQWRQVAGPSVFLFGSTTAKPIFYAPPSYPRAVTLTFELKVNDGSLTSLPDLTTVTIIGASANYPNISPLASVTASSEESASNQQAIKAIDGIIGSDPYANTNEWSTHGEGAGAWIQLNWDRNYEISRIVLHDRINIDDQITSATFTFSNGKVIKVGAPLYNDGSGAGFNVGPLYANSVRMTVNTVSGTTQNVGLAEMEVFGVPIRGF